jgi:hypothetical protein
MVACRERSRQRSGPSLPRAESGPPEPLPDLSTGTAPPAASSCAASKPNRLLSRRGEKKRPRMLPEAADGGVHRQARPGELSGEYLMLGPPAADRKCVPGSTERSSENAGRAAPAPDRTLCQPS